MDDDFDTGSPPKPPPPPPPPDTTEGERAAAQAAGAARRRRGRRGTILVNPALNSPVGANLGASGMGQATLGA